MTVATFDGVPLSNQRPIEWSLLGGVFPNRTVLEMVNERADRIEMGKEATLVLPQKSFKGLYALTKRPTSNPHNVTVEVMDGRWLWTRVHICNDYNLRQRTGEVQLIGRRAEVAQPKPEIRYWPHSLKGETVPWKAREVLEDVLKKLTKGKYFIPAELPAIEVEDLQLDDPGHLALKRVLDYIPGADVQWDEDGYARVYLRFDQSERKALTGLSVEVGGDYPRLIDLQHLRPSGYDVFFTCEPELRLDYSAGDQDLSEHATVQRNTPKHAERLILENVLPVPDLELAIPGIGGRRGRSVGRGTWVTVDEYLAALALVERPVAAPVITQQTLREHFLSNFARLALLFTIPLGDADPIWQMRIHALAQHWRTTFRLIPAWRDRVLQLIPYRAAVLDRETGVRALSEVHCDYLVRPSWRGFAVKKSQRHDHGWAINAYAQNLDDAKVAPFQVSMLDEELSIFHIEPLTDPWGEADSVAPGTAKDNKIPALAPSEFNQFKENYRALWEWVALDETWNMAVVMTSLRATPNGTDRLHKVSVETTELGKFFSPTPGPGKGPRMQLRVPSTMMTARFMWKDDHYNEVLTAFIKGGKLSEALLLNKEHVRNVAVAMAAAQHEVFLDRVEGQFISRGHGEVRPTGSLERVSHRLDVNGQVQTLFDAVLPVKTRDLFPFLPAGTRKFLLHTLYRQS